MTKKIFLFSTIAILVLTLLFMCSLQTVPTIDDDDESTSSASTASGGGSSSAASNGSSSSGGGSSSVGDSTNFGDAILISTDGTKYLANLTTADQDYYKFNGVSGTTYVIEIFSVIDDVDTYIYLYDSAQILLTENDDGGSGVQSKIIYNCTSTEIYYVMVEGYDTDETGDYAISVQPFDIEQTAYLKSAVVTPGTVTAPATVTVQLDINRPTGVTFDWVNAILSSPNEYQNYDGQNYLIILTYNGISGLWEGQSDFNIYNESGTWILDDIYYSTNLGDYYYEYDDFESTTYYYDDEIGMLSNVMIADVNVTTSNPDTVKPVLTSISANPISIDSTGFVNFTATATDALSGVSEVNIELYNDSISDWAWADLTYNSGNWEGSIDFAPLETGTWYIDYITVHDNAENVIYYYYDSFESTSFYCYDDPSPTVSTIPLVAITKTGSVSSVIKKSQTDAGTNYLSDRKIPEKRIDKKNIKKPRKK